MNSKQSPVWLWLPAAGAASVGVVTLVGALVDSGALQDFGARSGLCRSPPPPS